MAVRGKGTISRINLIIASCVAWVTHNYKHGVVAGRLVSCVVTLSMSTLGLESSEGLRLYLCIPEVLNWSGALGAFIFRSVCFIKLVESPKEGQT